MDDMIKIAIGAVAGFAGGLVISKAKSSLSKFKFNKKENKDLNAELSVVADEANKTVSEVKEFNDTITVVGRVVTEEDFLNESKKPERKREVIVIDEMRHRPKRTKPIEIIDDKPKKKKVTKKSKQPKESV